MILKRLKQLKQNFQIILQYEFYIMSQKGDIKVTIVILKNNIIKILDDENHQVHYYQSQNINYEKLNIDHLPW